MIVFGRTTSVCFPKKKNDRLLQETEQEKFKIPRQLKDADRDVSKKRLFGCLCFACPLLFLSFAHVVMYQRLLLLGTTRWSNISGNS